MCCGDQKEKHNGSKENIKTPKPKNIRWPRDEACTIDLIKKVPLKSTTKQQLFNSLITLERICRRQQRTIFHLSESSRHNLNSKRIAYLNLKIHLKNLDDEWREYTKDLRENTKIVWRRIKKYLKVIMRLLELIMVYTHRRDGSRPGYRY